MPTTAMSPCPERRTRLVPSAGALATAVFDATCLLPGTGVRNRMRNAAITVYRCLGDGDGSAPVRYDRALDALARLVAQLLVGLDLGYLAAGEAHDLLARADDLAARIQVGQGRGPCPMRWSSRSSAT